MKNLNLTFAVLLSTILFISCDKLENIFEEEGDSNNPQIEMNTQEVLFNTDGGNNTFSFTTNESWTAQVINSRADNGVLSSLQAERRAMQRLPLPLLPTILMTIVLRL